MVSPKKAIKPKLPDKTKHIRFLDFIHSSNSDLPEMQQKWIIVSLGLLSIVAAKPILAASLVPAVSPFRIYPGFGAPFDGAAAYAVTPFGAPPLGGNPLGAPLTASPLAVSSSQRLDYFNQFNAAFAPPATAPARLLAANGPFFGQFPASNPARFIQPSRLIAPGVTAPFFF